PLATSTLSAGCGDCRSEPDPPSSTRHTVAAGGTVHRVLDHRPRPISRRWRPCSGMQSSVSVGVLAVALLPILLAATAPAAELDPGPSWRWTAAGACPYFCRCSVVGLGGAGLRTADCSGRRLASAEDLQLPRDTDAADLNDNAIWTLQDSAFRAQGLTRLLELHLARNGLREVGAWAFAGLRRLRLVDLSHNHLQTLHPGTFDDNRGLKVLLLAGNNLASLPADRPLLAAPRLQVLDLSDCRLAHLSAAVLSELPALASLNLSANYLIQVQPQALGRQRQLQVLDLTHNPLACDLNTRQLLQQLSARNVTVTTSCPAPGVRAPVAQLSKHLARLQADVLPRPAQDDEREPSRRGEEIQEIEPPAHVFGSARTQERMVDLSELSELSDLSDLPHRLDPDAEYPEDALGEESPPAEPHEATSTTRRADTAGCIPLFADRTSKNPMFIRDWFDHIPSFWAALFGCQVGLVLGLVIAACASRFTYWRALCCCCWSGPGPTSRTREGPEVDYAGLSAESWEDILDAIAAGPCGAGSALARTCGEEEGEGPQSNRRGGRPETPPPAYADLVEHQQCLERSGPLHVAA
ncbi:hypothetical protein FOCC_FOCC002043, partial [Frankliniella occidentalis]